MIRIRGMSVMIAVGASLAIHGVVGVGVWFAPPVEPGESNAPGWARTSLVMLDQPMPAVTPASAAEPPKPEVPKSAPPAVPPPPAREPERTSPPPAELPEPKPDAVRVGIEHGSSDSTNPLNSELTGVHTAREGDQDQPGTSINPGPGGPSAPASSSSQPSRPSPAMEPSPTPPPTPAPKEPLADDPAKPTVNEPELGAKQPDKPREDQQQAKPDQPVNPVEPDKADQPDKPTPPVGASTSPVTPTGNDSPNPTARESDATKLTPGEDRGVRRPEPLQSPEPLAPMLPAPDNAPKATAAAREPIDPNPDIKVGDKTLEATAPQREPDGAGLPTIDREPVKPGPVQVATTVPPAAPSPPPALRNEPTRTPGALDLTLRNGASRDTLQPLTLDQRAIDMILSAAAPQLSPLMPLLLDRAAPARTASTPAPASPSRPASTPGGGDPGAPGPKDSDAFSVRMTGEYRNGRVVGADGLDVRTVRPQFTLLARTFTAPRVVVVEMAFLRTGLVKHARILRSSGYDAEIDQPVLNAVYAWTADGQALRDLPDQPDAHLLLTVAINLR